MGESLTDVRSVGSWLVFVGHIGQPIHDFPGVSARAPLLTPDGCTKKEAFAPHLAFDQVFVLCDFVERIWVYWVYWCATCLGSEPNVYGYSLSVDDRAGDNVAKSQSVGACGDFLLVDGSIVLATWKGFVRFRK